MVDRHRLAPPDGSRRLQARLGWIAVVAVLVWTLLVAGVVTVATGRVGSMGLPTDGEGRPRGLLLIGSAALGAAVVAVVVYRRIRGPLVDLHHAVEHVVAGDYGRVGVDVRGPREVRLLTATFNDMAARLAADQEQRRRFLADITHELRNPLAVLQSEIEAQLDGIHARDDDHLLSLLDETRRLGNLVDDLHTLALAEAGQLTLRREPAAFGALVEAAVTRHEAHARTRGVLLRASIEPDLPTAYVDVGRIGQVLDNLLSNAVRHTPVAGRIDVAVTTGRVAGSDTPQAIRCRIADGGPGFAHDQLAHVFERFSRSGDSGGSGLGLSIARDLVDAHGGTIEAGNDSVTGGATVQIAFPLEHINSN